MSSENHTTQSNPAEEAAGIFGPVWEKIQNEGIEISFPKSIYWLNGAPGAGKGTHTDFILKRAGFEPHAAVAISDLLQSDEAKKLKDAGILVSDGEVLNLLMHALMEPRYKGGVMVDGFPRTMVQAECVKLFSEGIEKLTGERPDFRVIVLQVDADLSVQRQLHRGRQAQLQGAGGPVEVRKTDSSEEAARGRYDVFVQQTLHSLQSLEGTFPYHAIDASGTVDEVREAIEHSL